MKINSKNEIRGYEAPHIEICEVVAERGFEASMPGTTINPWEDDGDSLEF